MIGHKAKNKRIAKNTLFLTIRMLIVTLVYIYTSRVVLNALGVVDYGIYNVIGGFVSMFAFLNISLTNGIQRFYNYELGVKGVDAVTPVYNLALLVQGVLAIIVFLLLESIGLWYIHNKMVIPIERFNIALFLFHFSVLSSCITIMQVPFQAAIMSFERMNYYAIVGIIDVIVNLLIALSIPYIKVDRLFVYGLLTFVRALIVFLLYFFYCKIYFPKLKIKKKYDIPLLKDMLSFSGWNMFGSLGGVLKDQGVNMILNLFFGPVVNAAKGISTQVSGAVQGFVSNISVAVRPQLTESYASGEKDRAFQMMYILSKISFIVLYLLSLPLIIEIDYVLHLWLGENVPENTNIFIIISIILNFLGVFSCSFSSIIHSSGEMKWYQIVGAVCNVMILPACYIALKNGFSAAGAYSLTIFFVCINLVITLLLLRKKENLSIRMYFKKVLTPLFLVLVTTIVLPFIPHYLLEQNFIRLMIVVVVSTIAIILSYYFIGACSYEKNIMNRIINKVIKSR